VTFAPFALATPTSSIAMPSVALDERGASIVWLDAHATLWLRREGRDVGQPIVVERLGRHARSPSLSARDGITCVAWGTGSGKGAIVSRCRAASGSLGPRLRVTRRTSKAAAPVPLVMETASIVAWSQPVEGPHEVFVAVLPKLATRDE